MLQVPDFRTYLNKSAKQAEEFNKQEKGVTLEQGTRDEDRTQMTQSVAVRWQSGSRLGGQHLLNEGTHGAAADRSVFAERWERIVMQLLATADATFTSYAAFNSTLSFKVEAYKSAFKDAEPPQAPGAPAAARPRTGSRRGASPARRR